MNHNDQNSLIRLIRLYHRKLVQLERAPAKEHPLQKMVLSAEAAALDAAIRAQLSGTI